MMMEQIVGNEAVVTVLIGILVALATVLVAVIRAVGDAAVSYIRERTGQAQEERRREIAMDAVSAVEQMANGLSSHAKRNKALEVAVDRYGVTLEREDVEAALKRLQGWWQVGQDAPLEWVDGGEGTE